MSGAVSYILSVTAAAVTASILLSLAGRGPMGSLIKLLAGIFVTLTVVSPVLRLELPDPASFFSGYAEDGRAAAAMGSEMADQTAHTFIKDRVETYILDKAALYGARLTVDVTLDAAGIPVEVTLSGNAPPYAKSRMRQIIREDLGIGEEAQRWLS